MTFECERRISVFSIMLQVIVWIIVGYVKPEVILDSMEADHGTFMTGVNHNAPRGTTTQADRIMLGMHNTSVFLSKKLIVEFNQF